MFISKRDVKYLNQAAIRYDCLINIFFVETDKNEFTVILEDAKGANRETKSYLNLRFFCPFISTDFFKKLRGCVAIVKLAGFEPTFLEWKSNVLTIRR